MEAVQFLAQIQAYTGIGIGLITVWVLQVPVSVLVSCVQVSWKVQLVNQK